MYKGEFGNFQVLVRILKDQIYICFTNKHSFMSYHTVFGIHRINEQICFDFTVNQVYELIISCFQGLPGFVFVDFNFMYQEPVCLDLEFQFLKRRFKIQLQKDEIKEGVTCFFLDYILQSVQEANMSFTSHMNDVSEVFFKIVLNTDMVVDCHFLVAMKEKDLENVPVQFKKSSKPNSLAEQAFFNQTLDFCASKTKTKFVGKLL